ncbi:ATP-binding cassette domain-containing protein [Collinsella ihumii]|uniref:ATP-binding cassette domain-containing protein n=1 Tax=Collinsella ihumii TaxID=1720204 RepID=A0ABT7XBM4_9ACTN|nr:ATP-binding cassette domain-containing protein [Collinsella ihumii]MDN0062814.1 ATP-binding cassette domain-containing protein [Collinsella ihumii]
MSRTTTQNTLPRRLSGMLAVLFWIVVWQLASMAVASEFILAGPLDALRALARLVPTAAFWGQIAFSFLRIAAGTAVAYALAIALAAAAHRWALVRTLAAPALSAIKSTPVACVVVVLLIWFGSRNVSAIAVFLMALPGIYFPVLKGLDELDPQMEELFCLYRADARTRLLAHVVPGVMPYLVAASATVLPMSWKAGVAAELIGVPDGSIGERIYQAKLLLETADLFAWTIVVVLVAWVFERAVLSALNACWPAAGRWAALHQNGRTAATPTGATIVARQLRAGHAGTAACRAVDFEVAPGEILCLMGSSGAGKTTMLSTITGLLSPVSGNLSIPDETRFAAVFQETRLVDDLTPEENVRLFAPRERNARAMLAELLPQDALGSPVRELSGGQRRRVELVRALAADADVVLLDEPFTGLDGKTHQEALAFVTRHLDGRPLIISTHDKQDALALGGKILAIS